MRRSNMILVALCGATLFVSSASAGLVKFAGKGLFGYLLYRFAEGVSERRLSTFFKKVQDPLWDGIQSVGEGVESFGTGVCHVYKDCLNVSQKDFVKKIKEEGQKSFFTMRDEWKKRQQVRRQENNKKLKTDLPKQIEK